ncbi:hypothetical protein C8R46DRAFT_482944 [Mycena filopes]|nr:hypothetical protein C8R46DRAFT_482944 [Mycena filopes]
MARHRAARGMCSRCHARSSAAASLLSSSTAPALRPLQTSESTPPFSQRSCPARTISPERERDMPLRRLHVVFRPADNLLFAVFHRPPRHRRARMTASSGGRCYIRQRASPNGGFRCVRPLRRLSSSAPSTPALRLSPSTADSAPPISRAHHLPKRCPSFAVSRSVTSVRTWVWVRWCPHRPRCKDSPRVGPALSPHTLPPSQAAPFAAIASIASSSPSFRPTTWTRVCGTSPCPLRQI